MSIPRRQNLAFFGLYPLERVGAVLSDEQVGDDVVADQVPLRGQHPAAGVVLGRLIVAAALFQHLLQRGEGQQEQLFVFRGADALTGASASARRRWKAGLSSRKPE